jgi:hypothetical protein
MSLDRLVCEVLNLAPMEDLRYGVELEFEGWDGDNIPVDDPLWELDGDPSLRQGGVELVSIPLREKELDKALEQAHKFIIETGVQANNRCGVHDHLNVRNFTLGQLWSLSCLYTLLEPSIFEKWCPDRSMNHFCVPSYSNTMLQMAMMEDITQIRQGMLGAPPPVGRREYIAARQAANVVGRQAANVVGRAVPQFRIHREEDEEELNLDEYIGAPQRARRNGPLQILGTSKYCAMSFYRLHDLGTVEMRQLEGTTDMDRVREWTRFLGRLWHKASTYADPLDLLTEYQEKGIERLCADVGLVYEHVDPLDQSEAIEAAMLMAGYNIPDWKDLDWKMEA